MQRAALTGIVVSRLEEGRQGLPVFSRTALKIQEMIERGEYDPEAVEKLIISDPALAAPLLRHANSSFFGSIERVVTVRDAIVRLGVQRVAELVILTAQKQQYKLRDPKLQGFTDQLWRHCVGCAVGTQWIDTQLNKGKYAHEAFLAGLLHDIGKLLLLRVLDSLCASKGEIFQPSESFVLELLATQHCDQGLLLMQHWKIPDIYASIVERHHEDEIGEDYTLRAAVRLADLACNHVGIGISGCVETDFEDCPEMDAIGMSADQLAQLHAMLDNAMVLAD